MNNTTPTLTPPTRACATHPRRHWIAMLLLAMLLLMMTMMVASVHAADKAEFTRRIELVCIGHTEAQVLRLLEREPDRAQRTNALGVHKTVLEYDAGVEQYTLTFYAGRLVAKTVRSRKPSLLDKLSP